MEPNQNNTEVPQIIDNNPVPSHNRTFPIFMILAVLVIFVSTAAVLFFNYQYASDASYREPNNFIQRKIDTVDVTTEPLTTATLSATPTPGSQEEATVDSVTIEDGTSDFSNLDQTASGL